MGKIMETPIKYTNACEYYLPQPIWILRGYDCKATGANWAVSVETLLKTVPASVVTCMLEL